MRSHRGEGAGGGVAPAADRSDRSPRAAGPDGSEATDDRAPRTVRTGKRRLVRRVYLFGVFLLVSVWIAVVLVGAAFGGVKPRREMPRRMLQHVAGDLAPLLERPDDLRLELARISGELLTPLSIHDATGAVVAAADPAEAPRIGADVLPAPGEIVSEIEEPRALVVPMPASGPPLYLVGLRPAFDLPLGRPLAIFAAVLAVLALVSIPFARSIARPLERLTSAAEELGKGRLSARSGLRRNDEVGTLAHAFDEMAARLEVLVRSEKELLANVSHELRTPLARIRVAVELAEEGDLDESRRYLREMGEDLLELDRLIEDVLTTARLDTRHGGAPPLRLQAVEPAALAERSASRFRADHPDRILEVDLGPGLPELEADPMLLRRVLDNLLDNARKYSDGPIELGARARDGAVELWVRDRGIGVDPEDRERLFEPFFRTDRSRNRRSGGLGLGLALARRIVEAHGGSLGVESEPEQGSTFTVRLPVEQRPGFSARSALPLVG